MMTSGCLPVNVLNGIVSNSNRPVQNPSLQLALFPDVYHLWHQ